MKRIKAAAYRIWVGLSKRERRHNAASMYPRHSEVSPARPKDTARLGLDTWKEIQSVYIKTLGFMKIRHTLLEIIWQNPKLEIRIPRQYNQLDYSFKQTCLGWNQESAPNPEIRAPFFLDLLQKTTLHVSCCVLMTCPFPCATRRLGRRIQSTWEDVEFCGREHTVGLHKVAGRHLRQVKSSTVSSGEAQTGLTWLCRVLSTVSFSFLISLTFFTEVNFRQWVTVVVILSRLRRKLYVQSVRAV